MDRWMDGWMDGCEGEVLVFSGERTGDGSG